MKPKKRRRGLLIAYVSLGLFVVLLAVLVIAVRFLKNQPVSEDVKTVLQEATLERAARADALAKAREALPDNAPIRRDWNVRHSLDQLDMPPVVRVLASHYISDAEEFSEVTVEEVHRMMEHHWGRRENSPLFFAAGNKPKKEMFEEFQRFLLDQKYIDEFETALDAGLCVTVVDDFTSPRYSDLAMVATVLAARSVAFMKTGQADKAMAALFRGYRVAELLGQWPHMLAGIERSYADKVVDRALWRLVDGLPPDPLFEARVLETLDRRKSLDTFAKGVRFSGAYHEAGRESETRGYPEVADAGFAFAGRGALERARRLTALVSKAPRDVTGELEAIGQHVFAGYWVNRFVDNTIQGFKMLSRNARMGDIARLAFALKAYAREHGEFPPSLAELGLPIPDDPLGGSRIIFAQTADDVRFTFVEAMGIWQDDYWIARKQSAPVAAK